MVKFLLDRPVAVIMSFLAFVILGVVTYFSIPVSLLPDIDIPRITVRISGDDMLARELENTATSHVRRQLQQVAGVSEIRSVTRDGSAVIYMDFDYGVDMDLAFIDANEKVDAAMNSLPREMPRPKVIKSNVTDIPAMYMNLTLRNGDGEDNEEEFLRMAWTADNTLRRILEQLPEVAMVDISGVPELTLAISPDRDRMKSAGITDADITTLLQRSNSTPGSMTVRDGYYEYNISVSNSLASASDVAALQLSHSGRMIRLGDIADIRLTQKTPAGLAYYNGRRAVSLAVVKQNEEHIDGLRKALQRVTEEFADRFPDYELSVSRDQTQLLDATMSSLIQNLALGLILVFIVTAVFLDDLRTPFVIGISIMVALALTSLMFYLFGISLNVVSVSGLILAVGMMIDNSVIVTENITQYRAKGLGLRDACAGGTSEMITPLLSSTLTTVAVFVPLIFMSGIAGAIFADQAFSITVGLAMSYVAGIALLPVLYRLFFTDRKGNERQLRQTIRLDDALDRLYDRISARMFRRKWLWLLASVLTIPAGILLFVSLRTEKIPAIEHSEAMARIEWNEPVGVAENARRTAEVSAAVLPGSLENSAAIGVQDYLLDTGGDLAADEAELYFRTDSPESVNIVRDSLRHAVETAYPKASVSFYAPDNVFEKIFASTAPDLEVRLYPKERQTVPSPQEFRGVRDAFAGNVGVPTSEPATRVQTDIVPDRDRIALYNVNPSELDQALASAFRDREVTTLRTSERYIPITMQTAGHSLTSTLNSIFVRSNGPEADHMESREGMIPVSRLVSLGESADFKEITAGKNGEYLSLGYDRVPDPGAAAREITATLRTVPDWDGELGGAWFSSRGMIREMIVILAVSLVMMYFILCAQFESFTQPLIVLFEIPVDTAFALLALKLTGNSLNIMSAIGIVVTCGIVVNDSILKLDAINTLRRQGMPLLRAIHTAGVRRIRPILMTSLTTIIAMVPMLFTDDLGSLLQRPLAIAMIGSMTVGTLVSIFIIPILYYVLYHRSNNAVDAANAKNNEQD